MFLSVAIIPVFAVMLLYCFERFRERLGVKVVKALKRNNDGVTHAAIDMLCALMCVSILILVCWNKNNQNM